MGPDTPLNDEQQFEVQSSLAQGNRTLLISVVSALAGALVAIIVMGFTLGYGKTKPLTPSTLPPSMGTVEPFSGIPALREEDLAQEKTSPSPLSEPSSPKPSIEEERKSSGTENKSLPKTPAEPAPSRLKSLNPPPLPPGFKLPPLVIPPWNKPLVVEPSSKPTLEKGKTSTKKITSTASDQARGKKKEESGSSPKNQLSPPEFKSPLLKGLVALEQGHLDTAITEFKKAVEENPKDPVPHLLLRNLYERKMVLAEKLEEEELYRKMSAQELDQALTLLKPKPFNPEELPAALSNP